MLVTLDHEEIQEALADKIRKKLGENVESDDIMFHVIDDNDGEQVSYRDIKAEVPLG